MNRAAEVRENRERIEAASLTLARHGTGAPSSVRPR
jgi:hypothetical protein